MKIRVVTDEIRRRIITFQYPPGLHMQEVMLADELGVSRTPIRSALASLHKEGLLQYSPKRGYFVRSFGPEDVAQAWDFRGTLEGMACRLVSAGDRDEQFLQEIQDCLIPADHALAKKTLTPRDIVTYRNMNREFHDSILLASKNRFLIDALEQFKFLPVSVQLIERYYETETASSDALHKWLQRTHDDHHRIADAIAARQAQRAEALMIEHVYFAGRYIMERVAQREASGKNSSRLLSSTSNTGKKFEKN